MNNKLLSLLQTFSKHELNRFKKFISSPFFNENNDLVKLFDIIDAHLRMSEKDQSANPLQKEEIWKNLFGNKVYKDVRFRRLCSDLVKLTYKFMAFQKYQGSFLENTCLIESLNSPAFKKHFESITAKVSKDLNKKGKKHSDLYLANFQINNHAYNFLEKIGSKKNITSYLEKADYNLECFYISRKLKNYCDFLNYRNVLKIDSEIFLPPFFLDYVKDHFYEEDPLIKAFYLTVEMLLKPQDDKFFKDLKLHLEENADSFTIQELDTFYIYLKNYCIDIKINNGNYEYFFELFEIFKILIQKEIILKNGSISQQSYKNIITVGLYTKEYQWTEQFIQNYTSKLPAEHRENALNYNLAKVYFSQEKYNKVIEQLRTVEYKNHVYALGGKLILLKTYYELKEYQALDSLIDSFRIYIRRNTLIAREVKQSYLNMIRFVKKLSGIMPGATKELEKTRLQIEKCKALAGKKWVLEKLEELEK